MAVLISRHAEDRVIERLGLNKLDVKRHVEMVCKFGCSSVGNKGAQVLVWAGVKYVFHGNMLSTIIPVMDEATIKKSRR